MLEPKDARVCILDDDVPDLAGIAVVGVEVSRFGRGHVKGVVGNMKDAPKIPRSKAGSRVPAYPCNF